MSKRTLIQVVGLAAIGSLSGFWVALSERSQAAAAPPGAVIAKATSVSERETATASQETKKPHILVIFGDDIGQTNIS